ncbi:MAG: ATP-binding cassette domain-containing protein [Oscillospiraceae bacterium]
MSEPIIEAKALCKQYITHKSKGGFLEAIKQLFYREKVIVDAVKQVSFSVQKGEIVGLLGKNGAGKSSIIKMLTGVLLPTSGTIQVLGFDPFAERLQYVRKIGAVFGQKSQLIWDIPPIDSFRMNQAIYAIPTADYQSQLSKLTTLFGVEEVIYKPTRVLSLGERMKCEFIMAMLHSPEVVFLDEPTIGIDIFAKETIRKFVEEMNAQGVTFILTTHDLEEIEKLARRVIVINNGEKVFEDSITMLKQYLGNKKRVYVRMNDAVEFPLCDGVTLLTKISEYETELLVDNNLIGMGDFITQIAASGSLADISIKEMDIEEIIKSIYINEDKPVL